MSLNNQHLYKNSPNILAQVPSQVDNGKKRSCNNRQNVIGGQRARLNGKIRSIFEISEITEIREICMKFSIKYDN